MYILQISSLANIVLSGEEVTLTSDYQRASPFYTIGDAMRVAAEINDKLQGALAKVVFITSVSSKL